MKEQLLKIEGGNSLNGITKLQGAKNAVLPILAASILTAEPVKICNCPKISDVDSMCKILNSLNLKTIIEDREIMVIGTPDLAEVAPDMSKIMRSSMFMLGALLNTLGEVKLYTPGGCKIGARPLDIHLSGLEKLGAKVEYGNDYVHCFAKKLKGADIVMPYPSVGATENLIMASVLAKGTTHLIGCAREPEIISLVKALRSMGAVIKGEGASVMCIEGVEELVGAKINPVTDRIVCGSILSAVALCGGEVEIENANINHLQKEISILRSKHTEIKRFEDGIKIKADGIIMPTNIVTGTYPLFATDMQAPLMACLCFADGKSTIKETVFENRFYHIEELRKMNANISVQEDTATIIGKELVGSNNLRATDLRGGAGLVIASLKAKGKSEIRGINYLDRGYEKIENIFSELGGNIKRV